MTINPDNPSKDECDQLAAAILHLQGGDAGAALNCMAEARDSVMRRMFAEASAPDITVVASDDPLDEYLNNMPTAAAMGSWFPA